MKKTHERVRSQPTYAAAVNVRSQGSPLTGGAKPGSSVICSRRNQTIPLTRIATGKTSIASFIVLTSAIAPTSGGLHRSPKRWIAKMLIAIALARSANGTDCSKAALIGDVDRNKKVSHTKISAKNAVAEGESTHASAN